MEKYELRMTLPEAEQILSGVLNKELHDDNFYHIDLEDIQDAISTVLYLYNQKESIKVESMLEVIVADIDESDLPKWVTTEEEATIYVKTLEELSHHIHKYLVSEKRKKFQN